MTRRVRAPAAVRRTLAAAVAALGVIALVSAFRIPMEAGGLVFGPILLLAAFLCLVLAVDLVAPRRPTVRPAQPNLRAAAGWFLVAVVAGALKLLT